ncbi:MAG: hypothetical protein R2817_14740 [Flavobacteriales bacterium]
MKSARHSLWAFVLALLPVLSAAQVVDPNAHPVRITGALGGTLSGYQMNGINARQQPLGYSLSGTLNLSIYGWSLPFSVAISRQGSTFSQPFTRFGVSPEYKWVKLHAGHRNLRFSEFTLNNITFLGGGVELRPKALRFSAMYGMLQQAQRADENRYGVAQYKRMGYGALLGLGKKNTFDLTFFRAADDVTSLPLLDTLQRITPQASTTIGLRSRVQFAKDRLVLDADLAVGAYTRDLNAPRLDEDIYADQPIVGELGFNYASNVAAAGTVGLDYVKDKFTSGVQYRMLQPGFRTLGANYLLSDVEQITLRTAFPLAKDKLQLSGQFGVQRNNLSDRRFASTARNIGSANIAYRPSTRVSVNLNYANFSIYQTLLLDTLFADSVLIDQVNHQVNVATLYQYGDAKRQHSWSLMTGYQQLSDRSDGPTDLGNRLINLNLQYQLRWLASRWGLVLGANYNDYSALLTTNERYGATVGGTRMLKKDKLLLRLTHTWNRSQLPDRTDDIHSTNFSMNYRLSERHALMLSAGNIRREGLQAFTETRGTIGYRMRF